MSKCKIFFACILCFALLTATYVGAKPEANMMSNGELIIKRDYSNRSHTPRRDQEDEFWTYRFMYSSDGGENWSEIMGAGDTGVWEVSDDDTNSVYNADFENIGFVVDSENNVNFIAPLYGFSEDYNPYDRSDGVYHIKVDTEDNATWNQVYEAGEHPAIWADAGIDADDNLYCIWWTPVDPDEGDDYGMLQAAKSIDGGESWSDAYLISEELHPEQSYPHMTPTVGEYFYVLYQMPVEDVWNQYIYKVPASLEGDAVQQNLNSAAGTNYSYYMGAVSPINQDVTVDPPVVYCCHRSNIVDGVAIGYTDDGGDNWSIEQLTGAQRYPSIGLDVANSTPFVFSNFGIPPAEVYYHSNWFSYDELGYGGGGWTEPADIDSTDYPGEVLYVAGGAWPSEERLVAGCNVWNYPENVFTPSGYQVRYSDDMGETWSGSIRLFDIWTSGIQGGPLASVELTAGTNNYVFVEFGGRYGYTDIIAPFCACTDMDGFNLGFPKIVTVEVSDNVDIYYDDEDEYWDVWIDWMKISEDTSYVWGTELEYDSLNVDDNGIGTYKFAMPDEAKYAYWENDTLKYRYEPLEAGDEVLFYSYCWDGAGNKYEEHNGDWYNVWTVNEGWTKVKDSDAAVPVKFEVGHNYPNPFNSSTVIPFSLNRPSNVTVSVYDVNGRLVDTIFQGQVTAGQHSVAWLGEGVTSGVYIYTLEADIVRHVGKMTLLR